MSIAQAGHARCPAGPGGPERPAAGGRGIDRPRARSQGSIGALVLLALLTAFALPGAARAQQAPSPVTVRATLDRGRATVGDSIGLTITIEHPPGISIDPTAVQQQFGDFEILSASPPADQAAANGNHTLQLRYQVAVYHTGPDPFPALTVRYQTNGQLESAQSQPVPLTIDSVIQLGDPAADIHGLKPQIELPGAATPAWSTILRAAAAALLTLLLVFLVWLLLRRVLAGRRQPVVAAAPRSYEAEARAELDRIAAEGLLARGDYATHYALLAECIRTYITQRFGLPAFALTTAELRARMVAGGIGRWRARLVSGLLEECDAVQFAHYLPAPERSQADLQMAFEIVDLSWTQAARPEEIGV